MPNNSIAKNALFNLVYKGINILFPLITMIYVARILMPVGVGKVASAQNIVAYFVIIASLGLPTYGVKKIAASRDSRNECSKIFSELFVINAISTLLCSIAYLLMIIAVESFHAKIAISLIVGIQLFANFINIDWVYQGFEDYRYIMYRNLVIKIISLIAVFIFVRNSDDYIVYALITTLSLVANYVFNIVHLPKYVSFQVYGLDIKPHIKPVLTLLAASIAIEIYTLADTTMLSFIKGDEIVGYYSNSAKCIGVVRTAVVAICAVFLPRLNYYIGNNRIVEFESLAQKGIRILLSISIPICIALVLLADDCVLLLFGKVYFPSVLSMRILSISIITVSLSNFFGYQILVTLGKEKIVLHSTIIGAIINVLLNLVLIRQYAHYGAAVASVISEGVIAIYQFTQVRKCISIHLNWKFWRSLFVPSIVLFMVICAAKYLISNSYIELIISAVVGVLAFCVTGILFKNEFLLILFNHIKLKTK